MRAGGFLLSCRLDWAVTYEEKKTGRVHYHGSILDMWVFTTFIHSSSINALFWGSGSGLLWLNE